MLLLLLLFRYFYRGEVEIESRGFTSLSRSARSMRLFASDDADQEVSDELFYSPLCEIIQFTDSIAIVRGGHRYFMRHQADWAPVHTMLRLCSRKEGAPYSELIRLVPPSDRPAFGQLLRQLAGAGILIGAKGEADLSVEENTSGFYFSLHGVAPPVLRRFVASADVTIVGDGEVARSTRALLLAEGFSPGRCRIVAGSKAGPETTPQPAGVEGWDGRSVRIFISETGDPLELLRQGHAAWLEGVAFVPAVTSGWVCTVGPSIVAPKGPCARCLLLRKNSAFDNPQLVRIVEASLSPSCPAVRFITPAMAAMISALLVSRTLALAEPGFRNFGSSYHLLRLDDLTVQCPELLEVPYCTVCSGPNVPEFSFDRLEIGIVDDADA